MNEACREAGSPNPRIQIEPGELWVEFPFSTAYLDSIAAGGRQPEHLWSTTQKTTQEQVLAVLRAHPSASRRTIAERLEGITGDGVKYHLEKLKRTGRIRRVGPDRGGHWEVIGGENDE